MFGVRPWIDEAELFIGDSLIEKISQAIDQVDYLAAILSPRSVGSSWVRQELEQAMTNQLDIGTVRVLPLLLEKCDLPGFLRGKLYADFTDPLAYDDSLARLLRTLGATRGAEEFYERIGRHFDIYTRPKEWFCIYCGWKCTETFNDYICKSCGQVRPWAGGSATMRSCYKCKQLSLAIARYCEWCGSQLTPL